MKRSRVFKIYSDFLKEYKQLGYINEISKREEEVRRSYYVPHLSACRGLEKSKSTLVRIAFNASCLTTKPLNSTQYNGGDITGQIIFYYGKI